jgi:hypothetical protein
MAKRPAQGAARPLDIFDQSDIEKASAALSLATAPQEAPERAPKESPKRFTVNAPQTQPDASSEPHLPKEAGKAEDAYAALSARYTGNRGVHVGMKLRLPRAMKAEFQAFKAELSSALGGVFIEDSNIGRSLLENLLGGDDRGRILEVARERGEEIRRPANSDAVAMAEFDAAIGAIFLEARKRRRRTTKHDD